MTLFFTTLFRNYESPTGSLFSAAPDNVREFLFSSRNEVTISYAKIASRCTVAGFPHDCTIRQVAALGFPDLSLIVAVTVRSLTSYAGVARQERSAPP